MKVKAGLEKSDPEIATASFVLRRTTGRRNNKTEV
jgi:hypothetical protein